MNPAIHPAGPRAPRRRRALPPGLLLAAAVLAAASVRADDEGVYGPAAPPDSAYLRVFNATGESELDARIADEALSDIGAYSATDFVSVPPGQHTFRIGRHSEKLTLRKNLYYTAALAPDGVRLLENTRYENRLKALLILYNLLDDATLSLQTQDGKTPVIDAVRPRTYGTREVNAVKAGLAVYEGGQRVADVPPIALERGRAFSLFIAGRRERPVVTWAVN